MLRRYGSILSILVVIVIVTVWVVVTDPPASDLVPATDRRASVGRLADIDYPDGVVPWDAAVRDGTVGSIRWGPRCDTSRGTISMPTRVRPSCFAPYSGDNGGSTARGVTADRVRVVAYQAAPSSGIASLLSGAVGLAGDPDAAIETYRGFVEMFSHYFETYGRRVEVVPYRGTGDDGDPVAATADAERIAAEVDPFLVIGVPLLTNAFAETLADRGIVCFQCTPGQENRFYVDNAPYVWDLQKNPEQNAVMVNEYIGKRLARRPARFAGDPALAGRTRRFGAVTISLDGGESELGRRMEEDLRTRFGVTYDAKVTFSDPTGVTSTARDMITQLKEAGVTTVVYTGDPFAPVTLTKVATDQGYFPEWLITGTALIDTSVMGRFYDQRQWAHAFGPSNLFVRTDAGGVEAVDLYRWYFGVDPPAGVGSILILGAMQALHVGLQLAGPELTAARFRDVLFRAPLGEGTPTFGQLSFGERGFWSGPDYCGIDDQTEVWWDPDAVGVDEIGRTGPGMWRYVDGGVRHLPGEWPAVEPEVFDRSRAVLTVPDPDPPPAYPPLR